MNFEEIISIAWAADDKHLVLQTGSPNWALLYWSWLAQNDTALAWTEVEERPSQLLPPHIRLYFSREQRLVPLESADSLAAVGALAAPCLHFGPSRDSNQGRVRPLLCIVSCRTWASRMRRSVGYSCSRRRH